MKEKRTKIGFAALAAALLTATAGAQVRTGAGAEAARPVAGGFSLGGLSAAPLPALTLSVSPMLSASVVSPAPALGSLQAAAPLAAAAISGLPAVIPASWVGDHEEALLNGTAQERDAVMRGVADGSIGLRHPGDERQRRAEGIISGVTADWTPRLLDSQAAALAGPPVELRRSLRSTLMSKSTQLEDARRRVRGPLETLTFGVHRIALDNDSMWKGTFDAGAWLERLSRRTLGDRRPIVTGLAQRIPGLNADRVLYRTKRVNPFKMLFLGYSRYNTAEGASPSGFAWISASKEAEFFHIAAHEGWHQGDYGYSRGQAALRLLFGEGASGIQEMLVEGYTEMRARRTLAELHDAAVAGRGGELGERYLRSLRVLYKTRDNAAAWRARQDALAKHRYHPFVEAVSRLDALPGGREALEAFVRRGDVAPLISIAGERRFNDMAIALLQTPPSKGPFAQEAYAAADFPWLFRTAILPRLADGSLELGAFERMKAAAVAASVSAAAAAYGRSPAARAAALARLPGEELVDAVIKGDADRASALAAAAARPRKAFDGFRLPSKNAVRILIQYVLLPLGLALGAAAFGAPLWGAAAAFAGGLLAADVRNAVRAAFAPGARLGELGVGAREDSGGRAAFGLFRPRGERPSRPERPADWTEAQARAFLADVVELFRERLEAAGYEPMPMMTWDDMEADCRVRFDGLFHNVILSRGFLSAPGMTADALALSVAHEIGHMLGAGPKDKHMRLAVEGEADYFSGAEGPAVLTALGAEPASLRRTAEYREAEGWLKKRGVRGDALRLKARALAAALRLRRVFHTDGVRLDLGRPDETVVAATATDYPSDQARLDTMAAGLIGAPRPRSWAVPGDFTRAE